MDNKLNINSLVSLSSPHKIITPFVKVEFGGETFGLTNKYNQFTKVRHSDFITNLDIEKYGSGAVNTYTLSLKYVITPESDPNYIDKVISKASDRKISFSYGDATQPEYSYKNEIGIISDIVPNIDYKRSTITYTITATSSTKLAYSNKKTFDQKVDKPSNLILKVLYDKNNGLLDLLPGMLDKSKVLSKGWIPVNDQEVTISYKQDISPMDYILYLVSLMRGNSGEYYFLKVIDAMNEDQLPHFEIISTKAKAKSQMMNISIGYPGSIPVYEFSTTEKTSIALMAEFREKIENKVYQDYGFSGDLVNRNYYSSEIVNGNLSDNLKNWWDKITSYPITASLTTDGLYVPAEIVQSIYLGIYFYGKKYNTSGEYLITGQSDSISSSGFRTKLSLIRIGNGNV